MLWSQLGSNLVPGMISHVMLSHHALYDLNLWFYVIIGHVCFTQI